MAGSRREIIKAKQRVFEDWGNQMGCHDRTETTKRNGCASSC